MNLVQRVQDILLKPKQTWPVIDREPATVNSLYTEYLLILAAIPAIAAFIGLSIVGVGGFGAHFRVPFFSGLLNMVVGYVLSLVAVYVLSLIVDALAPTFGGQKSPIAALKLVVYGSTAGMLGGVFSAIPALGVLGLLAGLYSIYLIYTGLPVLMKCPQAKAVAYTAVVIVCGIVMGVVLGALTGLLPGRGLSGPFADSGARPSVSVPGAEVKIDGPRVEGMSAQMEQAAKQLEAAHRAGNDVAAGKAMAEMLRAAGAAASAAAPK